MATYLWQGWKRADRDAETGKSSIRGWFTEYKLYLAIDTTTELPVAIIATSGNRNDSHELLLLLEKVTTHIYRRIHFFIADKEYDVDSNYLNIV